MVCKNCKGIGIVITALIYPTFKLEIPCPICNGKGKVLFNKKIDNKKYKLYNGIAVAKR